MKNIREYAYKLLREYDKKGYISEKSYNYYRSFLNSEDVGFLKKLVWGSVRNKVKEDWIISKFVRNYEEIPPALKWILRLGVYQIISNIPPYAAVNETVNVVRNKRKRSFVNAVLRNVIRNIEKIKFPEYVEYSIPSWLFKRLKENFPREFLDTFLKNSLDPTPVTLRVNDLKISREELIERLKQSDLNPLKTSHSPYGIFFLDLKKSLENLDEYNKGYYYIQTESSQISVLAFGVKPKDEVLEIGSGNGGKTTFLAQLMKNEGKIIAVEPDVERVETLEENLNRMGIENVEVFHGSIQDYYDENKEIFDKILIDAPCTSLATVSNNPEVFHRIDEKRIKQLANLQREMLNISLELVKEKGEILYVTCTLTKEENFDNMKALEGKVRFLDISNELKRYGLNFFHDGYGYYLFPEKNIQPFYLAKFQKV